MSWDALIHDPLPRLLAQILAVVICSRLLGVLARWQSQPMVIAEITAGILLGPSFLGWLVPDLETALFARESIGSLQLISQLGLLLFMFLIGLELDPKLLRGRGRSSVIISTTSIVVPFTLGAALAWYLYPSLSDPGVRFLSFALFLAIAMSVTAFPVLARILSERRLLHSRVGAVSIACAAVNDVTAWCLLAFVVATHQAQGLHGATQTTVLAGCFIAVMFLVVRPLLKQLGSRVTDKQGLSQNLLALILLLLFASSWATELIGIHALFGAFVFGAILPKEGGLARALADKFEDLVLTVLLPLFFAYSGIRTEIGLLETQTEWLTCGLIIVVASVGKFGGSAIAARFCGMPWRESSAIGVLMNTRGLMELIVLNVGLDLGVISPTLFTMMVVMALVTTFMTTPILQLIYPLHMLARDLDRPEEEAPAVPPVIVPVAALPSIMICVSRPESARGMLTLAHALRGRALDMPVHALHLRPPSSRASLILEAGDALLVPMLESAKSLGMEVNPISFVSTDPARDICEVAESRKAELLIMGWHRPVMSQAILGGTVFHVMERAPCDVAVFVDRGLAEIRRVLVPFVGTDHDRAALSLARRLLEGVGAEITILHVPGQKRAQADPQLGTREVTESVFSEPTGGQVRIKVVPSGHSIEVALAESRTGYDLVVCGIGREWGLEQRSFGLQREQLIQESPASFIIVRGKPEPAAAAVSAT